MAFSKIQATRVDPKFDAAVEAIYDAAPCPALWPIALQKIADVFDDFGGLLSYGRDDGGFGVVSSKSLDGIVRSFVDEFDGDDLRSIRGRERGIHLSQDAVTDRDLVSAEEMESHTFYRFLARHGLKYHAGVSISPDPRLIVFLAVQRTIDRRPYTSAEMSTLSRLGRHAERSLRLGSRLLDAELTSTQLAEALARLNIGTFVLDGLRRVIFQNPYGERLIGSGLEIDRDHRLRVSPCPERHDIEEALESAARVGVSIGTLKDPKPMWISRPNRGQLAVHVLPITSAAMAAYQMLASARVIVLVVEPSAKDPPDPAYVRDFLGITLGEARIAALVGTGEQPRAAAARLDLTEETVRTVLKRIYAKVGVSTQSELTNLLSKLIFR